MVRLLSCSFTSKCHSVVAAPGGRLEDYGLKILGFAFKYLIHIHLDSGLRAGMSALVYTEVTCT